jgi:branched-subunit amino acid aminotransferase/4-amino-4-deoxychorismate lyase
MNLDGAPVTVDDLSALAMYNYGHFTSMLVTDGRVRGLDLHMQRLADDCQVLFDTPLDPATVRDLIRRSEPTAHAVVRVTVFAPDLQLGTPGADATPRILVSTRPAAPHTLTPLRVRSAVYQRDLAAVKHVGLLTTMWQRRTAQRTGADDALFTGPTGAISEGATWNIGFIDQQGRVVWPDGDCLTGVTVRLLDHAAATGGVTITRREVRIDEAYRMRAAFATNAAIGVRPIATLDHATYDPADPMLTRLADVYETIPGQPI